MTEQAKPGPDRERPRAPAPPPPPAWRNWLLVAGLVASILILFLPSMGEPASTELSYSNFLSRVRNGDVNTAVIDANGAVTGTLSGGGNYETQIPTAIQDQRLAEELEANDVEITAEATPGTTFLGVIFSFLPFLLLIGVYLYIGRRAQRQIAGGVGGILGSRAKVYDAEAPSTRFSDVAGYEGAKQEISEVVDFLKYPDKFAEIGARIPKGVLLVGPPGAGKTLLARAVAGEAAVPFFFLSASEFVEMFVGVGASRVRDLFEQAKEKAPCIV
ncbi:MAG TPA: ATP-dependent metallopeptidase FtsH/Yme1/Tma family protein, partial [Actinomycetota bacterium]|nr:ATP-dependent metallopeptidase FtsH/Yme1/Tma family protein [Actinomycetota bacterium]